MAVDAEHRDKTYGMSKSMAALFHCPTCTAKYEIVRVEAPPGPTTDREIVCVACGGPLLGREGKFLLKYFLVERPRHATTYYI
jgi:hypothetical protein